MIESETNKSFIPLANEWTGNEMGTLVESDIKIDIGI